MDDELDDYIRVCKVGNYEIYQESYRVYKVVNQINAKVYYVWSDGIQEKYTCNCPMFLMNSNKPCKHIILILNLEGKSLKKEENNE